MKILESAPTYQVLPARPGYVPVYIRMGDEPLENINPDLAAAFGRTKKSVRLLQIFMRSLIGILIFSILFLGKIDRC